MSSQSPENLPHTNFSGLTGQEELIYNEWLAAQWAEWLANPDAYKSDLKTLSEPIVFIHDNGATSTVTNS